MFDISFSHCKSRRPQCLSAVFFPRTRSAATLRACRAQLMHRAQINLDDDDEKVECLSSLLIGLGGWILSGVAQVAVSDTVVLHDPVFANEEKI